MSQNTTAISDNASITTERKSGMKGKDFITTGIFGVLFIVVFFICIMLMSMMVVTQPFGMALTALVAGPIYMLLRAKVAKPGSLLLFGALFAIITFVTGSGWPMLIAVVIGTVVAELVARAGGYKSFWMNTVGYAIFMLFGAVGSYTPLLVMKDYYLEIAAQNGVSGEFMIELVNFMSGPVLVGACAAVVVCAILGALLARALLKKHFVKAGIIKEGA